MWIGYLKYDPIDVPPIPISWLEFPLKELLKSDSYVSAKVSVSSAAILFVPCNPASLPDTFLIFHWKNLLTFCKNLSNGRRGGAGAAS
jgi:hypothetical protein